MFSNQYRIKHYRAHYYVDIKYWWFPFKWWTIHDKAKPWAQGFMSKEGAQRFIEAHKKDFVIDPFQFLQ